MILMDTCTDCIYTAMRTDHQAVDTCQPAKLPHWKPQMAFGAQSQVVNSSSAMINFHASCTHGPLRTPWVSMFCQTPTT